MKLHGRLKSSCVCSCKHLTRADKPDEPAYCKMQHGNTQPGSGLLQRGKMWDGTDSKHPHHFT
jgi:hypothetical protein